MWTIEQVGDRWQLRRDGADVGAPHATYAEALAALAADATVLAQAAEQLAAPASGVLPERWHSPAGAWFSEPTGDGRDFTSCAWSWRDPSTSLLPLMFQTKTDMGHFGAELAGFIDGIELRDGTGHPEGLFYDSEMGRAARDLLLEGRRFGVSVDPGAVDASWECTEEDEDGWCVAERITFEAYEVIGLTMTPFPAFANASIELAGGAELAVAEAGHAFTDENDDGRCDACIAENDDGDCTEQCGLTEDEHDAEDGDEAARRQAVAAAAQLDLVRPPREWFERPEPDISCPLLVDQGDGRVALPLTITEQGEVYGHAAVWGEPHVGYPGQRVTPPHSPSGYANFHTGLVRLADGSSIATGPLTVGADHAPVEGFTARRAQDHYANVALAWADVRAYEGVHGIWVCGALRPNVSPELRRVLEASSLSGDWRCIGGDMEMIAVLAVNTPGFGIRREALAAAAIAEDTWRVPRAQARTEGGATVALVAAGHVRRCTECGRRGNAARARGPEGGLSERTLRRVLAEVLAEQLGGLGQTLAAVELRTRHLRGAQADSLRQRRAAARR